MMSRAMKCLAVTFVISVFLFSFAADLLTAREVAPGKQATWLRIRLYEGGASGAALAEGLPVGMVDFLLRVAGPAGEVDCHGRKVRVRELWEDLKRSGPAKIVDIRDSGARVQIWLE